LSVVLRESRVVVTFVNATIAVALIFPLAPTGRTCKADPSLTYRVYGATFRTYVAVVSVRIAAVGLAIWAAVRGIAEAARPNALPVHLYGPELSDFFSQKPVGS
jgi:hypothetical protein